MRPAVAALVLLASLAGCSGGGGSEAGGRLEPAAPGDVIVAGVAVDSAIRPVPGATVAALGTDRSDVTDDEGRFELSLPTGAAVLEATHPRFAPARMELHVAEGMAAPVLRFGFTVETAPFSTVAKFDGFIVCSLAVSLVFSEECGEGVGTPVGRVGKQANNAIRHDFQPDSPALKTAIVEQAWEPTSQAGEQLSIVFATEWTCEPACGGEGVGPGSVQGPSPLFLRVDEADLAPHLDDPAAVFTTYTLALTDTVAANVVLNQPFQLFVSLFYREPAPEGYSLLTQTA